MAAKTYNILMMGASYGSLLASKLLFGGHTVKLVCLPAEADLINAEGFRVRLPIRGRKDPIEIDSRKLPGKVSACGPADVDPRDYDLVGLAMQEPQYGSPGVRELLDAVAKSKVPCMSIMNMPPLPYIKRIPGLNYNALLGAYTDPSVWNNFEPGALTLCSPDPQAIRPPDEKVNVLMVTLPTNFKVARFEADASTATRVRTPRWRGPSPARAVRVSATRRTLAGAPVHGPGSRTRWKAAAGRERHCAMRCGRRGARIKTVTPGVARRSAAAARSSLLAPASRRRRRCAPRQARRSRWAAARATWYSSTSPGVAHRRKNRRARVSNHVSSFSSFMCLFRVVW